MRFENDIGLSKPVGPADTAVDAELRREILGAIADGMTRADICRLLEVSRSALYRFLLDQRTSPTP